MELVVKGNQYLKGKQEAFGGFRDALAGEISRAWPEMKERVDEVVGKKEMGGKIEGDREQKEQRENGTV